MSKLSAYRTIRPLLGLYPWATPVLIVMGLLNSLMEWLGIALLIPLFQTAGGWDHAGPLYGLLARPFSGLSDERRTLSVALLVLVALTLKVMLAYGYTLTCNWLQESVVHKLRCRIFSQLMRLGPGYLDSHSLTRAIDLASAGTEQCGLAYSYYVWLLINLCTIAVFSVMLCVLSFKLTCLVGVSMVMIALLSRHLTARAESVARTHRQGALELRTRLMESLAGIATIYTFARERYEESRHTEASNVVRRALFASHRLSALIDPVIEGLSVAVLVALMVFALRGHMPLAILVTFIFMLYRVQPQVKLLERNRLALVSSSVCVEEVLALLDPADKTFVQSGDRPFSGLRHEIELRAVSFCYRTKATPAIKDISLHIPKGKLTALVGPSGAGKSTIVNLICRFYDVTAGEILVDGTPLNAFESGSWRSRIAVVSQDPFLFAATIAKNIAYSRPGATRAEIQDAARRAHAHEFICELPEGYETLVGDRGVRLSGGQRQRIAIARAFLCSAELLILDEATNELDGLSEALIQEVVRSLRGHCTVLAIAHRLSTIAEADHIVVLDKGCIVEDGQLGELIEKNGLFARLYRSQRSVLTENRQLEAR